MSGRSRRSARDRRRRSLSQNVLVDQRLIEHFVDGLGLGSAHLVVEIGAGTGALTFPLAETGARIWAIEADPAWARHLRSAVVDRTATGRVRVLRLDARRLRAPLEPYRVVANLPFGATTDILARLLDRPELGPDRADVIVQFEVARKLARQPPSTLRAAAWAPWWELELGRRIGRDSFRPRPSVDAAVLTVRRRDPPVLPLELAPDLREALRGPWAVRGPQAERPALLDP